ncbi:AmrA [Staphylococcus aureus]|uniref:AmrA n=1 Tax=Staphylococcus aureus TaxID=1280 RepID=A0A380DPF6_STAAU|nr:AmrA [Staphylococcus aureus]
MKSDSLKENIIYQGLYQLIRTMTPLITIPIISRAFGPSGVGIVSFSFNIVQYFLMIASVGVQLYLIELSRSPLTTNGNCLSSFGISLSVNYF